MSWLQASSSDLPRQTPNDHLDQMSGPDDPVANHHHHRSRVSPLISRPDGHRRCTAASPTTPSGRAARDTIDTAPPADTHLTDTILATQLAGASQGAASRHEARRAIKVLQATSSPWCRQHTSCDDLHAPPPQQRKELGRTSAHGANRRRRQPSLLDGSNTVATGSRRHLRHPPDGKLPSAPPIAAPAR